MLEWPLLMTKEVTALPNKKSAEKRVRIAERNRLYNRYWTSRCKTAESAFSRPFRAGTTNLPRAGSMKPSPFWTKRWSRVFSTRIPLPAARRTSPSSSNPSPRASNVCCTACGKHKQRTPLRGTSFFDAIAPPSARGYFIAPRTMSSRSFHPAPRPHFSRQERAAVSATTCFSVSGV